MSEMSFDIINKGKKITSIQASSFKDAMKSFAENYDMPDANIEYTLGGINDFIKINKTGYKKV